jgi:DNA-binding CsgD family transcriptional regulator
MSRPVHATDSVIPTLGRYDLRTMRRGRPTYPDVLTPREWEVLALLREGLTNKQIGARLGISERGAKYHVSEILSKLGLNSREDFGSWRGEPLRLFQFSRVFWVDSLAAWGKLHLVCSRRRSWFCWRLP